MPDSFGRSKIWELQIGFRSMPGPLDTPNERHVGGLDVGVESTLADITIQPFTGTSYAVVTTKEPHIKYSQSVHPESRKNPGQHRGLTTTKAVVLERADHNEAREVVVLSTIDRNGN